MALYKQIFNDFTDGDISSFYKVMYPELLVYVARILGDEFSFLAEDCVQDAVMKAWNKRKTFPSYLQWKVFIYTCVRNGAISILRKGHAKSKYMDSADADSGGNNNLMLDIIEQETLTLLYEAVSSLPEEYREIFELSFEQGLKNAEAAARLCVAEITIKKRKARLVSILHDHLKGRMDGQLLLLLLA